MRARRHDGFVTRYAVDADTEKAADAGAEEGHEGEEEDEDVRHGSWSGELLVVSR